MGNGISFEESIRRYEQQRRRRAELQPAVNAHNKKVLLAALETAGVRRVEVTFDGYGDSGQIDDIAVTDPAGFGLDALACDVELQQIAHDGSGVATQVMALPNAIEHICYDLLGAHHPGWENNDGAYGDFVFDVAADQIIYTHNNRYTEVDTSE